MTARVLSEQEKMRQVPGIVYMDGALGRRAHVAGTGCDVFEVIKDWRLHHDMTRLAAGFDWFTPEQLDAALRFYALFPGEIDARLKLEDEMTE